LLFLQPVRELCACRQRLYCQKVIKPIFETKGDAAMLAKRFLVMLLIALVSLFGAAACTAELGSEGSAMSSATEMESDASEVLSSSATESDGGVVVSSAETESGPAQAQVVGEDVVVDAPQLSEAELENQPPGKSAPGPSAGQSRPGQSAPAGGTAVYTDSAYQFAVNHPADFVLRALPADELAQFSPTPDAVFTFMNPVTAASDIAEYEPADLELRVYALNQGATLNDWLVATGLLSIENLALLKPFQAADTTGVELCASTMIAPGCSYFFVGNGRVYRLTPATLDGEAMLNTFRLNP
jgi:hypothetical protein